MANEIDGDTFLISPEEKKILEFLNSVTEMADGPAYDEIAHYTNLDIGKTRFLLDELEEKRFVDIVVIRDEGSQYHLTKEGRRAIYS